MNNNPFKNITLFTKEEAERLTESVEFCSLISIIFNKYCHYYHFDNFIWLKLINLTDENLPAQFVIDSDRDYASPKLYVRTETLDKLGCVLFKIDFNDVKNSPYLKDKGYAYELGEFFQTTVEDFTLIDTLFNKLSNNTLIKTGKKYIFIESNGYKKNKYYIDEYQLEDNKYILYKGKWLKVEPIIWIYSETTNSLYNLYPIVQRMNYYSMKSSLQEGLFVNNFTPSKLIVKDKTVKFSELKQKLNSNSRYINLHLIIDKDLTSKDIKEFYKEYAQYIKNLNIIGASNSTKALFFLLQTYAINISFDRYKNKDITEEKEQSSNEEIKEIDELIKEIKTVTNKLNIIDKSIILIKIEELVNNYNKDIKNIKNSIINTSSEIELSTTPKDSQALKQNLIIELNNILSLLNRKLLLNPLLSELNSIKLNIQLEETELSNLVSNVKLFINNLDTNNKKIYTNELNNIIDKYYNNISSEINLDIYSNIKLNLTNVDYKSELMKELNSFYKSLKENKKLSIVSSLSKYNKLLDGDTNISNTLYVDGGYLNTIEQTLIDIYKLCNKLDDDLKKEKITQITNICNEYLELISNKDNIEEIIKLEKTLLSILTKELLLLKIYFIKNGNNIDNDVIDTSKIRK